MCVCVCSGDPAVLVSSSVPGDDRDGVSEPDATSPPPSTLKTVSGSSAGEGYIAVYRRAGNFHLSQIGKV